MRHRCARRLSLPLENQRTARSTVSCRQHASKTNGYTFRAAKSGNSLSFKTKHRNDRTPFLESGCHFPCLPGPFRAANRRKDRALRTARKPHFNELGLIGTKLDEPVRSPVVALSWLQVGDLRFRHHADVAVGLALDLILNAPSASGNWRMTVKTSPRLATWPNSG